MKHILFIVGPALGHVSRCLTIARKLANISNNRISFATVTPGYGEEIVKTEFTIEKLAYKERGDVFFADAVEKCIDKFNPDIVCFDLTPMRWLTLVRFPNVPLVYITNFFLTNICDYNTIQDIRFKEQQKQINHQRVERGLSVLTNIKNLYELGDVLLCDSSKLIDNINDLPPHYHVVGPCFWEPEIELPIELEPLNNVLLIALGSTGRTPLPQQIIDDIVDELNIKDVVWLGANLNRLKDSSSYNNHYYTWLPATKMLSRSKFVISQGGSGSTYQALAHGVPCGVWPTHKNQEILGVVIENKKYGLLLNNSVEIKEKLSRSFENLKANCVQLSNGIELTNGPLNSAKQIYKIMIKTQ